MNKELTKYQKRKKRISDERGARAMKLRNNCRIVSSMLSGMVRQGSEIDKPEGARFITISDTLAKTIAEMLTA